MLAEVKFEVDSPETVRMLEELDRPEPRRPTKLWPPKERLVVEAVLKDE